MRITARVATPDDIPPLVELYRRLEDEMSALHPMWPVADGLAEPVEKSLQEAIEASDRHVLIGQVDDVPLGFLYACRESLLPQGFDQQVGSIRLVYTDGEAREVGVAEVMRDEVMDLFRREGITKFDAHVLPGHRLAKNFFEAGGFSARSIIMYHDDAPSERPGRDPRRL